MSKTFYRVGDSLISKGGEPMIVSKVSARKHGWQDLEAIQIETGDIISYSVRS